MEIDDPWLEQKLRILVLIKAGPAAKLLSWQQHSRCHLVSFLMYISGAKFEEHRQRYCSVTILLFQLHNL